MSRPMNCRRSIPTFALTLSLILPTVAVAGPAGREPERGRVSAVLESLWLLLGLAPETPVAVAAPATSAPRPGGGTPPGGEGTGGYDPNGGGDPPPGYDPDLDP